MDVSCNSETASWEKRKRPARNRLKWRPLRNPAGVDRFSRTGWGRLLAVAAEFGLNIR